MLSGAGLAATTGFLRSVHAAERQHRVREHLDRGRGLGVQGRLDAAAEEYRAAVQLDRRNADARRALALSLVALGRLAEGESYLRDLLRQDPASGPLNRGLARVHAARGRDAEARGAYQRAIYGQWPPDRSDERIDTRFELIDYLTRLGAREEVLAELLRLRAELPPGQTAAARRTADLLVDHGAAALAIDMLRTASLTSPRDVDLLAHMADLQAGAGEPFEARTTLRKALAIERRDDLAARLRQIDHVLEIDPTLPRLGLVTRTRRARRVLSEVFRQTAPCEEVADVKALRLEAARRLRAPAGADAARAEQEMGLAAMLWSAAPACHADTPEARAIGQVLARMAAAESR